MIEFELYETVLYQVMGSVSEGHLKPELASVMLWAITRPDTTVEREDLLPGVRDRMGGWAESIAPVRALTLIKVKSPQLAREGGVESTVAEMIDLRAEPSWTPSKLTRDEETVFLKSLAEECAACGSALQSRDAKDVLIGGPGAGKISEFLRESVKGDAIVAEFMASVDETFATYDKEGGGEL